MPDYMKLQNGSDIRGVAIATEGGKPVNLTREVAQAVGGAFAKWLREKCGERALRVAVGRDSRLSGEQLSRWITEGLCAAGMDVTDFGLCTTPAMFMCTVMEGYCFDGAVMITASHLPFERNGFKFFTSGGGLEKKDISAILSAAGEGSFETGLSGKVDSCEFIPAYAAMLTEKIRAASGEERPLDGLRIIVDAGNGAGGFFADKVLLPLGADITGSQYLEPDGHFPNHAPNPENAAAMEAIREAVLANNADLGIIFDTDVDRAGAVLKDGSELNRNRLIAILAAILLREHPGTTIVTDSITSTGLAELIAEKGGIHHRFKRGYRNVINEAVRLTAAGQDAQMAIETSGHGALQENYYLDDGAYLMVKLLIELARARKEGRSLESLIQTLREPVESAEFRMPILAEDFAACGNDVIEALREYARAQPGWKLVEPNYEGVRVDLEEGWFLLRLSLHDPIMPLNIESDVEGGVQKIAAELLAFLQDFTQLDCGCFTA
ncbi:MAG: phosphomannomutase/phosphoglucomutase [Clostridia bacterium]|nr:phosphomannomutase/phosphoglucomutase [Clostridia bacterium]